MWGGIQCQRWCFITWLVAYGKVFTRARLFSLGYSDDKSCVLCGGESETVEHLWFRCPYVSQVVDVVCAWIGISFRANSLHEWLDWFAHDKRPENTMFQCKLLALCAIVYFTWRARNVKLYFCNAGWLSLECAMVIVKECKSRIETKCKVTNDGIRRWRNRLIL